MLRTPARLLTAVALAACLAVACSQDPATDGPDAAANGNEDEAVRGDGDSTGSGSDDAVGGVESEDRGASDTDSVTDARVGDGIRFVSMSTNYSHRTNTLTLDATRPPGTEPGDVLVAQFFARSTPVSVIESGWTLIGEQGRQTVWVKVVTEDEPNQYTWMQGDPDQLGRSGVIVVAYRGVDIDDPVIAHAFESGTGSSRELVAPSVDTEVDGATVVRMWSTQSPGDDALGIQPPFAGGLLERARIYVDITNRAVQTLADAVQEEAGPSGEAAATTTWDVSGSWNHTIVLRPAARD